MARKIIGVIGDSECGEDTRRLALEVGSLIAQRGGVLICGGYGGVMEAAAEGAKKNGGLTVGILSGKERGEANPWIDIPIVTGMGEARNAIITRSASGIIAVAGGFGTLSEIGFCLKFNVPLVGLQTWKLTPPGVPKQVSIPSAENPKQAVDLLFDLMA